MLLNDVHVIMPIESHNKMHTSEGRVLKINYYVLVPIMFQLIIYFKQLKVCDIDIFLIHLVISNLISIDFFIFFTTCTLH